MTSTLARLAACAALLLCAVGCNTPDVHYHLDRLDIVHVNPDTTQSLIRVDLAWDFDKKADRFMLYEKLQPQLGTVLSGTDRSYTLNFSMGPIVLGWKKLTLHYELTCMDPKNPRQPPVTYSDLATLGPLDYNGPAADYNQTRIIRLTDPTGTSVVMIQYHLERLGGKVPNE